MDTLPTPASDRLSISRSFFRLPYPSRRGRHVRVDVPSTHGVLITRVAPFRVVSVHHSWESTSSPIVPFSKLTCISTGAFLKLPLLSLEMLPPKGFAFLKLLLKSRLCFSFPLLLNPLLELVYVLGYPPLERQRFFLEVDDHVWHGFDRESRLSQSMPMIIVIFWHLLNHLLDFRRHHDIYAFRNPVWMEL